MKNLLLLAALAFPAIVHADAKKEAKIHIEKATAFHGEGKFREALDELTTAYTLDPKPELLYAIGQVHVQLGNCPQAITFYQRFLTTKPAAGPAAAAKEAIQTCKTAPPPVVKTDPEPVKTEPVKTEPVKTDPEPVKTAEPVKTDPVPVVHDDPPLVRGGNHPPNETPPSTGPKPWYKDVIGDVLVLGGVGLGVAGVFMYTGARSKIDDAENAPTYKEHQDLRDDAKSQRNLAIGLGIGSAVLIGAGVIRYKIRDTGEHRSKVVVTPTTDGGVVTWMGRF